MIGRTAIGYPWIFSQVLASLNGQAPPKVSIELRFNTMKRYLRHSVEYIGEQFACPMMRSRLAWFVKGLPNASQFRKSITRISSEKEALDLIDQYWESLRQNYAEIELVGN